MVSEAGSGHRAGGADLASWVGTAGTVARIDLRLPHHPRLGSPLLRYVRYNRSQARAHPAFAPALRSFTRPRTPSRACRATHRPRDPRWVLHPDNLDAQAVTLRLEVRPPPPRRRLVRPPASRRPPRPMHPAPPGARRCTFICPRFHFSAGSSRPRLWWVGYLRTAPSR